MASGADPVRQIADAVLYEGYILWPYRRSAMKNRRRWTFGGVYPRAHSEGREDDPCEMRAECLLEGPSESTLDVRIRFLQVVERQVLAERGGELVPVDELCVDGERHLAWEEAREREVAAGPAPIGELTAPRTVDIDFPEATEREELVDASGSPTGAIARSWRALRGSLEVGTERRGPELWRVTVRVSNGSPWEGGDREDALAQTFASTHAVLRVEGGRFASLTDPPAHLADEAADCRNEGVWPVLAGEPGDRSTVLASPIILEDHPRVAPESPGDLFDGGEIDQLLTLSILSLTDEEKEEMRATDPRAREILERTESLAAEDLMRLHGTFRDVHLARRE